MLSLEKYLNSLDFCTQLETVKNLMDKAQTRSTFWGSRLVEVEGFSSSVYLDDLAEKILEAGSKADDLTPAERVAGIEIARKINVFYQITDDEIQNSNFLTRFFNWLQECSCFYPYTTRFWINYRGEDDFCIYSQNKFLQQFGGVFNEENYHDDANNTPFDSPPKVLAKETSIRALVDRP